MIVRQDTSRGRNGRWKGWSADSCSMGGTSATPIRSLWAPTAPAIPPRDRPSLAGGAGGRLGMRVVRNVLVLATFARYNDAAQSGDSDSRGATHDCTSDWAEAFAAVEVWRGSLSLCRPGGHRRARQGFQPRNCAGRGRGPGPEVGDLRRPGRSLLSPWFIEPVGIRSGVGRRAENGGAQTKCRNPGRFWPWVTH